MNIHNMKLHASPFNMIKSGEKTIELRLYDEKRRQICEGDIIIFTNTATGEKRVAEVKKLHRFDSFEELYRSLPLLQCGYTAEDIHTAHPSDMELYYSADEQKKYGVVGIELQKELSQKWVIPTLHGITVDDVFAVYDRLKDKYALTLTTTGALDDGYTIDCPIIVGKAHGQIIKLYECDGLFILDVTDEAQTMGTHWHPNDVERAVYWITEFMEGKSDFELIPFPQQ